MATALLLVLIYIGWLSAEAISHKRRLRSIPLRIEVLGTRGKSSVVRMLTAALEADGYRVTGKSTGSQACYILPDGRERTLSRRFPASITEQIHLVKEAVTQNSNALVVESMAIQPENMFVESRQIIQPNIVVLTNIGRDHVDALGKSGEQISSHFCRAIPGNSILIVPTGQLPVNQVRQLKNRRVRIEEIETSDRLDVPENSGHIAGKLFPENDRLVRAVGKKLGINSDNISRGIRTVRFDIGAPAIWSFEQRVKRKPVFCVNGFSANDPDSTGLLINRVQAILSVTDRGWVGLLNLRSDRADRSRQWLVRLKEGFQMDFRTLYVCGAHAAIFRKNIKNCRILKRNTAAGMMETILAENDEIEVLLGMVNLRGIGAGLIKHWQENGENVGI